MTKVFPSILPSGDDEFVDNKYSAKELGRMEWQEIRQIATRYDTDEINGRSERAEMIDYLEGKERL